MEIKISEMTYRDGRHGYHVYIVSKRHTYSGFADSVTILHEQKVETAKTAETLRDMLDEAMS